MASGRAQKKMSFFQEMENAEKRFKLLGLSRPQDTYPELLRRARQINFGLIMYPNHLNENKIREWRPTDSMLESKKTCIGIDSEFTPTWIRTSEDFQKMYSRLITADEFAVDVECHSHRTLKGYIALIQIGTYENDYLIDPFGLREEITTQLKEILESSAHLKVCHDVRNDNLWLQRDYDIFMNAVVDTQVLWNLYSGEQMTSLLKLIQNFYPEAAHKKAKSQTISDWRLRPGMGMSSEQEQYAVVDVHLTLRIFDKLRYLIGVRSKELLQSSFHLTKERLLKVYQEFQNSTSVQSEALKELNNRIKNPKSCKLVTAVKDDPSSLRKYLHLYEWRQQMCRILDDKAEFILTLRNLVELCLLPDATAEKIKTMFPKVHPSLWNKDCPKPMQAGVVCNIIHNEDFIQQLREMECHNCLKTGHGPAWSCPFPRSKENYKKWMNRPENLRTKDQQNQRRFNNLVAKFGEEKAGAAVFPAKI